MSELSEMSEITKMKCIELQVDRYANLLHLFLEGNFVLNYEATFEVLTVVTLKNAASEM
jgi:hypothetical protein